MTRTEMLNEVIRKWGIDHRFTLRFAKACEKFTSDLVVETLYRWTMSLDVEAWD